MHIEIDIDYMVNEIHPYKRAKLVNFENNLHKAWYVEFWVWHIQKKKLVRRRIKHGINRLHTVQERASFGWKMVKEINQLLADGYCMGRENRGKKKNYKKFTMIEAIDLVLQAKREDGLSPKTLQQYSGIKVNWLSFVKDRDYSDLMLTQLNPSITKEFLDYLVLEKGLTNRTRNNMLTQFKMIVTHFTHLDRTLWKENPTAFFKKLPTTTKKHTAYSPDQMKLIKSEIMSRNDKQLLLFIQFIYFCFIRPGREARFIKLEHIEKERLFIPEYNSKNRKGDWVSIPKVFQVELAKLQLDKFPGHYYLFTSDQKPGLIHVGKNYFYKRFKKILDATGLKDSSFNYDIYGFKHSGNINMFKSGIPLDIIQKQNRHHSIDQTNQYLRDLDLFRAADEFDKVPSF